MPLLRLLTTSYLTQNQELVTEIKELLHKKQKIAAVKLVKTNTGLSLHDALNFVDQVKISV
ncbi:conserved hypothetical protein [Microscilla marina ATCC 23134]|uniref:Uncharacterized protein n=1 Tax=Microscilla marina ATCC 23134 TaxID=313606 RepID=A1ZHC8_MICM2|nr:conserved hypothetical protein [Microscilla marina ATCC 23134]